MINPIFENVRKKSPLIHTITNYVTANDCANMLLACGASPIMADDVEEAVEITGLCHGLTINLGTLNQNKISSMLSAGKRANELGHPVILDPVGIGASKLRTETALRLIKEVSFSVIRANISEMKVLISGIKNEEKTSNEGSTKDGKTSNEGSMEGGKTRGVDADISDQITEENLAEAVLFAQAAARKLGAVVAISGAIDIVADQEKAYCIRNGHPMMRLVTGTGCQLSALTAAFAAANPNMPLEAAAAAVCAMGVCGEIGCRRLSEMDGNASYRNYIIDAMYHLTPERLEKEARYEVYEDS
ncbi:MAG: hydroxyethylthiazole kinase [Lachnospiraceae bacterium]|nr:hydroxyethylthiazole kinase [Lachnospiraceae bacterium]